MKVLVGDPGKCKLVHACEKACAKVLHKKDDRPHSAIRVDPVEGQPRFQVCNQCGECIEVCPTGALSRAKSGVVLLKKDLCVACYMCVGFCPSLSMARAEGVLPPFKCISCGQCAKACPEGALALVEQPHEGLPS
jgi:anaerobic carbon-monoxide dehydrogenase iron sulfur subunit